MRVFYLVISLFACTMASAQYTLQQCIDSALRHSIPVQQSALDMERQRVTWNSAKAAVLPVVGVEISHGINSGRSIDPFSNTYVNQTVNRAGYGVGADLLLFNGGSRRNAIRQQATSYEASRMDWKATRGNLVLTVILSYLQVLRDEDAVVLARQQIQTSAAMVERLEVMNKQGAIRPSDLSDLRGQLFGDRVTLSDALNRLNLSKLLLLQQMNQPFDSTIRLSRAELDLTDSSMDKSREQIFADALQYFAPVAASELRTRSAEWSWKAARGQLFPTLVLGTGINTNYSSLARDASQNKISYSGQLKNNRFSTVGLGLSIPILNGNTARNRIRLARLQIDANKLDEENVKRNLQQWINEAYLNMTNAQQRMQLLAEQAQAFNESFRAAEVRFQSGVGTSVDYLYARERMDRANVNWNNARYELALRKEVLQFYSAKRD